MPFGRVRPGVAALNALRLFGDQTVGKASSERAKRYDSLFGDSGLADFFGSGDKAKAKPQGQGLFDRNGETW